MKSIDASKDRCRPDMRCEMAKRELNENVRTRKAEIRAQAVIAYQLKKNELEFLNNGVPIRQFFGNDNCDLIIFPPMKEE